MNEKFAEINGIQICYEIQGEGEPLFLIHGFTSKKETFIAQVPELSKCFRVIRLDNRGSGKSDRPNEPYTLDIFADDVRGLMDYLEIKRASILGYSLGGMIAQIFALKYPNRLNKLILLNTLPHTHVNEEELKIYIENRIANYDEKLKNPAKAYFQSAVLAFTPQFRRRLKKNPKEMIHGLFTAEDLIRDSITDTATPQDIKNQANAFIKFNILDKLNNIQNETLILCGFHDVQTPKELSFKMHEKIPNSKLIVIENAGHGSPKEKAPEVNKAIIEFLET